MFKESRASWWLALELWLLSHHEEGTLLWSDWSDCDGQLKLWECLHPPEAKYRLQIWCSVGYSSFYVSLRRGQRLVKLSNEFNCSPLCLWGKGIPFIFSIPCAIKQARRLEGPSEESILILAVLHWGNLCVGNKTACIAKPDAVPWDVEKSGNAYLKKVISPV